MTPTETTTILRQFNEWRRGDEDIPQFDPREIGEAIDAAIAMIDRLEAAESDALEQARLNGMGSEREAALMARLEAAEKEVAHIKEVEFPRKARAVAVGWETKCARLEQERDALRAKVEAMEKQRPVGWFARVDGDGPLMECKHADISRVPLYTSPGAQPAPIEQDTSVRKAWARFSNELHRSHDAPYPGMSEAFEQHFSQSFTDREWRAESATWAAAWKAAKRHEAQAQPAQRMNMQTADQITQAFKAELQALLDKYGAELSARDTWEGYPECGEDVRMHVDVPAIYDADHNCLREYTEIDLGSWVSSTQAMPKEFCTLISAPSEPSVPEGWKLVPIEPTPEMRDAWDSAPICEDDDAEFRRAYQEMITSAPRAK